MAGRSNDSNPDAMFGTNFKFTTANAEQRISAHATSRLFFNDDVITFQNAASGAADSAISWSERMRIDSSGTTKIIATKAFGNETATLRVATSPTGTNYSDGAFANIVFGDESIANSHLGEIQVVQLDASLSTASDMRFLTNSGGGNTNTTERMRIDSSGNVGIGTDSPRQKLDISGNIVSNAVYLNDSANNDRNVMFIDSSDNLLLATGTSAGARSMLFYTENTERMRITSVGDILVGSGGAEPSATQIGFKIGYASSGTFVNNAKNITTTTAHINFFNPNGLVGAIKTSGSSTSYVTSSDYRLKENVVPMEGALDRVDALKPSRFNFIADEDTIVDGFLAHEVQDIVPEAVTGDKDAMRTEEYEVTPAVYKDVIHPAEEAVYETIEHPAIEEELDEEGNVIVEGKDAYTEEILVTEAKEEWTENVLVSEAVMGTREVPDYQGIDQSKLVPLLVGAIKELRAEINSLKAQINN
jgi:hypothetical protein